MQESKVWQKSGVVRAVSLGTALSIILQMTCCYAVAYADTTANDAAMESDAPRNVVLVDVSHRSSRHRLHKQKEQIASADALINDSPAPSAMVNALASASGSQTVEAMGGLEAIGPIQYRFRGRSDTSADAGVQLASLQMPASTPSAPPASEALPAVKPQVSLASPSLSSPAAEHRLSCERREEH